MLLFQKWVSEMSFRGFAAFACGAAIFALAPVAAASPEPVNIEPGAVFVFNDGRVERLVEDRGETQLWATRRGREFVRSRNFTVPILDWKVGPVSGSRTISGKPDSLWPPSEGANSRFRVATDVTREDGKTRRSLQFWTCSAGKFETRTLPFGDAEVLPVSCDRFTPSSMKLIERRTWLWAPEVGHYVQRTLQNFQSGEKNSITLCAKIPARTATDRRISSVVERGC